eukprot:411588-Hanusia_phi.AAC.2
MTESNCHRVSATPAERILNRNFGDSDTPPRRADSTLRVGALNEPRSQQMLPGLDPNPGGHCQGPPARPTLNGFPASSTWQCQ